MENDALKPRPDKDYRLIPFVTRLRTQQPLLHAELIECLGADPSNIACDIYNHLRKADLLRPLPNEDRH